MLPFLKVRKMGSIAAAAKSGGGMSDEGEMGEVNHALLSAAEDLISAVGMKDAEAVAQALEAAYEICSSSGYESEHLGPPSEG